MIGSEEMTPDQTLWNALMKRKLPGGLCRSFLPSGSEFQAQALVPRRGWICGGRDRRDDEACFRLLISHCLVGTTWTSSLGV